MTDLADLGRRLVGRWTTEATHVQMPGTVISGSSQIEWLDGERFLVYWTHNDHHDFPDALSVLGDTGGRLAMHYFDSRGVYRLYDVTVYEDGWGISMEKGADQPFAQRVTFTFDHEGRTMTGRGELSHDGETWEDDIAVTYQLAGP
jgi:hypothetical protein